MPYPPESDAVPLPESLSPTPPPTRLQAPRVVTGLLAALVALHVIELAVWLVAAVAAAESLGMRRLIVGGIAETVLAVGFGVAAVLVAARRSAGRLLVFTLSGLVLVRGFAHLISLVLTAAGFAVDWDAERYLSTSLTLVAAAVAVMVIALLTREPTAQLSEVRAGEQAAPDPRRPGAVIAAGAALGFVAGIAALAAVLEAVDLVTPARRPDSYLSHLASVAALFAVLAVSYLTAAALLVLGRESGRVLGLGCAGYLVWLGVQGVASPSGQLLLGLPAAAIGAAVIWVLTGRRTAAWLEARRTRLR